MKSDTNCKNWVRTKCRPSQHFHWFLFFLIFLLFIWSFVFVRCGKLCKGPLWSLRVFRRHILCKAHTPSVPIWVRWEHEICCSFGSAPSGEGHRSFFFFFVRSSSYGKALGKCESVNLTLQVLSLWVSMNRLLCVCFLACFSAIIQTLVSVVCMCKRGR